MTAAEIGTHWWGCAAAIESRLAALLPAGWAVSQARDLASIPEHVRPGNTLYLVPLGTMTAKPHDRGRVGSITMRWALVFAATVVGDQRGTRQRDLIGSVIPVVLRGLMGWSPGGNWSPLSVADPPGPDITIASHTYYPLAIQVSSWLTSSVEDAP